MCKAAPLNLCMGARDGHWLFHYYWRDKRKRHRSRRWLSSLPSRHTDWLRPPGDAADSSDFYPEERYAFRGAGWQRRASAGWGKQAPKQRLGWVGQSPVP